MSPLTQILSDVHLDEAAVRRIGTAARDRTFAEHTSERRAVELIGAFEEARSSALGRTAQVMEA